MLPGFHSFSNPCVSNPCAQSCRWLSIPSNGTGCAYMLMLRALIAAERAMIVRENKGLALIAPDLAKVEVVRSSLVSRFNTLGCGRAFNRSHASADFIFGAKWQSGHAAACKAVYAGSIPTLASNCYTSTRSADRGYAPSAAALNRSARNGLELLNGRRGRHRVPGRCGRKFRLAHRWCLRRRITSKSPGAVGRCRNLNPTNH
jgi:hypothetical protein